MKSYSDTTLVEFLRLAASDAPTPGGGGIAALSGCLGAAMASMAIQFTVGREKFAQHEEALQKTLSALRPLLDDMLAAIDDDAHAFSGISDAYKFPKGTDEEKAARRAAIDEAVTASMRVPLRVLRCCDEAVHLLPHVAATANPNLLSDVEVSAIMLTAAARAALVNVYANSTMLKTDAAREAEAEGERLLTRIQDVDATVKSTIADRK
ncbi:MAG: cyclodeaminase/cyclohydrolase family protein [Planctomycetaceae bacterium]|nr:cyclodeaminase/cyclohydrolase family protein [Planctomycetaceae bacterium]